MQKFWDKRVGYILDLGYSYINRCMNIKEKEVSKVYCVPYFIPPFGTLVYSLSAVAPSNKIIIN